MDRLERHELVDPSALGGLSPVTFELLIIALVITLEPIPLTGFILTLSTDKGARNGAAFLVGWVGSLVLVVVLTLTATGGKPLTTASTPSTAILAAKLALGIGLLVFAWHYRRTPPKPPSDPAWMKRLDQMSIWTAGVLAFLLQPWGMVAAAALSITDANDSKGGDVATLVAFCFLATVSYLVMEGYVLLSPENARARLNGLRAWIDSHKRTMIIYLSVGVGLLLVSRSAYALAA